MDFPRFQEPDEPRTVAFDWQYEPIYEGDQYIETELGYVLLSEVNAYLRKNRLIKVAGEDE